MASPLWTAMRDARLHAEVQQVNYDLRVVSADVRTEAERAYGKAIGRYVESLAHLGPSTE